jgi:hypothetical protein
MKSVAHVVQTACHLGGTYTLVFRINDKAKLETSRSRVGFLLGLLSDPEDGGSMFL